MEIILTQDVEKLGFCNEIITVKNGYARNFLFPNGMAILATESAKKSLQEKLKQQEKKEEEQIEEANKIVNKLSKLNISIKANVSEDGNKLFGSIKASQLIEVISKEGIEINAKFIKLPKIKILGDYEAEIRINRSVSTTIPFKVEAK
tara:strand:- start:1028 stop:1471 length:444 start_codon:yes stop_codon:yes gene_type:complete